LGLPNIIDDPDFKFPLDKVQKGNEGVLEELQTPLQIKIEDIILDMQKFVNNFPRDSIPHTAGDLIVDNVHDFDKLDKVLFA